VAEVEVFEEGACSGQNGRGAVASPAVGVLRRDLVICVRP
jgi:ribonuclease HI